MDIQSMRIENLRPYLRNQKKHSETQIKNVAKSIEEFGMVQPLVIDIDGNIIIGHCRYEACRMLGIESVPVLRLEDLSASQANKLRLLDNKLNESPWDSDLLREDIPEIDWSDYALDWEASATAFEETGELDEQTPPDLDDEVKTCECPSCGFVFEI